MTCQAPEDDFFVVVPGEDDYPTCSAPAEDGFLCPDHATPDPREDTP